MSLLRLFIGLNDFHGLLVEQNTSSRSDAPWTQFVSAPGGIDWTVAVACHHSSVFAMAVLSGVSKPNSLEVLGESMATQACS